MRDHVLIDVQLLGGFDVHSTDGAAIRFATRKTEALLAVLSLRPGATVGRDTVCGLLWPGVQEPQARHSLRQTLLCLRKGLGRVHEPVLRADPRRLALDPMRVRVDAWQVLEAARLGTRGALIEAANLWRGPLLEGLSISEAPFQHWVAVERERLRQTMIQGLTLLCDEHVRHGEIEPALQTCVRLVQLDPWCEHAHRRLLQLYARLGRRAEALSHYDAFARALRNERRGEPERQTRMLRAQLDENACSRPETRQASALSLRSNATAPATVGRKLELALLRAALGPNGPSFVLLSGEAGVGKTHLCERIAEEAQAQGVRVFRTRCFESERVLPLSPWVNMLTAAEITKDTALLSKIPASLLPELATLLPELERERVPGRSPDMLRLFRAIQALFAACAETAAVWLIIEDLHWADDLSLRLLCYLSRGATGSLPQRVLGSVRQEALAQAAYLTDAINELEREQQLQRVPLSPLSRDDSRALALAVAYPDRHAAASEDWLQRVWAMSEGNPLVIVESGRTVAAGGSGDDLAALPIPQRVRALIEQRVGRVSASSRQLLELAAVVGRELELELLRQLGLDDQELFASLQELVTAQLLSSRAGRLYFSHDRVRETLYGQLLPVHQQWLHGRVARALERFRADRIESVLGHVGYHYSKAHEAEFAVRYLMRFADHALRGHGVQEALAALEQAAHDSAQLPPQQQASTVIEIVTRQALCLVFLGRFAEIDVRLKEQQGRLEQLDAPELAAQFHFWRGYSLAVTGQRRQADFHGQQALAYAARCGEERIVGYVSFMVAYLCHVTGRAREGVEHGELATRLLAQAEVTPTARVLSWINLSANMLSLGDWRGAVSACQRALEEAEAVDSERCQSLACSQLGLTYATAEAWEEARACLQRGFQHAQEPFTRVVAVLYSCLVSATSGATGELLERLEPLIVKLDEHGLSSFGVQARAVVAQLYLGEGRLDEAQRWADECHRLAQGIEEPAMLGLALRTRAAVAQARGQYGVARAELDDALHTYESSERRIDLASALEAAAELAQVMSDPTLAQQQLSRASALYADCELDVAVCRVRARLVEIETQRSTAQGGGRAVQPAGSQVP